MTTTAFKLGTEFPREGFVQNCLERYFRELGYAQTAIGHVDFCCTHPTFDESWIIEAKGETADVGLDFRTGIGQLIQAMDNPSARYGLAVPKTSKFLTQLKKVPDRVRVALQVHWLIVDATGNVAVIDPADSIAEMNP